MLTECKKRPMPHSNHHYLKGLIQNCLFRSKQDFWGFFSYFI